MSDLFGRPDAAGDAGVRVASAGSPVESVTSSLAQRESRGVPEISPLVLGERYVVDRELGRGGMGQVLLAHDRRLNRSVAIKVLPSESCGPRELRRLEQEARVVGALGHPNVVEVHDIGSFEGRPFIVEEYLEGMTLRQRMSEGPLPIRAVLDVAAQVARGLAAAHDRGVVHCDIKPANLFVGNDGRVKILDFGVARANDGGSGPVETSGIAHPARFAGTPAYSSPEQIRCAPLDPRSDIFSLGCVLYEMLARRRPFEGPTTVEVGYAVLQIEPPPLPPGIPSEVRRIVCRCLEKDPGKRFQSAKDLVFDLEGLLQAPATRRGRWLSRVLLTIAAVAFAVAAALLLGRERRLAEPSFRQITFLPGAVWTARFTPGGRELLYTEAFDGMPPRIYAARMGQQDYQRLEAQDAVLLGLSASGDVALLRHPELRGPDYSGTLAILPPGGGTPRDLVEDVEGADWAPDGVSLAVARRVAGERRLEYPIGKTIFQTTGWISHPRVSPRGDMVAFFHHPELTTNRGVLMVGDAAGKVTALAPGWDRATGLSWSPRGSEIWFSASPADPSGANVALRAVDLRGRQRLLSQPSDQIRLKDVSRDGTVLVTTPRRYAGIAASVGGAERDLSIRDEQLLQDLASDGSLVLFTINPRTPDGEGLLFVRKTDGSPPVQIASGFGGALSPDAKWALIFPSESSSRPLSLVPIGAGQARALEPSGIAVSWARFFPDGRGAVLIGHQPGKASRLYVLSLDGGAPRPISREGLDPWRAALSPDGASVAAMDGNGVMTLYPVDGSGSVRVPEAQPEEVPLGWAADGGLLVGARLGAPLEVHRIDLRAHRRALWRTIRPTTPANRIVFSAGQEAFAYSYLSWRTHLYVVEGLR
ncbi:MAG: protein kinase domain-containing protein [Myxococcales bacterium]